ncbi:MULTISPECIES: DUF2480 family protein [Reichenbachiella]|uniref:DUF2480 family protein n=1 Tax=Reichenbachiella agariperforans TaxID=156994 RepID=A0A1M6VWW3_REIAG|nr:MULTISPECIES: DUF2480 family protein [Reichenbachiella]RJE70946.1 hypothetical protein BGP76_09210 [Reichenbachiella sp. MSK19-1]SHK85949.1 Protein of unknown function [Reichenbachiella agariperforans]
MQGEIVNKVAESSLITFDLESYYDHAPRVQFDIKDNLYNGLVLREKEFRAFVSSHDWAQYDSKHVAIYCSVDAIVPTWAYMLLTSVIEPVAKSVVFGDLSHLENSLFQTALGQVDLEEFRDQKVIIKGCGRYPVPEFAYVEITRLLKPVVSSLMYGEACSAVPLYKRPKVKS